MEGKAPIHTPYERTPRGSTPHLHLWRENPRYILPMNVLPKALTKRTGEPKVISLLLKSGYIAEAARDDPGETIEIVCKLFLCTLSFNTERAKVES